MKKLFSVVNRGYSAGTLLTPHLYDDGCFIVSFTRFEKDYVRAKDERELPDWVAKGYSVRMSNPSAKAHRSPSLISPDSIEVRDGAKADLHKVFEFDAERTPAPVLETVRSN